MQTEKVKSNQDHSPTTKDITPQAIMIRIKATLGHYTGTDVTTTGVAHDNLAQFTEPQLQL